MSPIKIGDKCEHANTEEGDAYGYAGGVGTAETGQEPRAAGGISLTETCLDCGARRKINRNQQWQEFGPWWTER